MSSITIPRTQVKMALDALENDCDWTTRESAAAFLRAHLVQPEREGTYSDIVSVGGFDPRNKFDKQPEQEPILKVYRGELCYKSKDDDQSYGMWCPVGDDTFPEGTRFYTAPPQRQLLTAEWDQTLPFIEFLLFGGRSVLRFSYKNGRYICEMGLGEATQVLQDTQHTT